MMMTIYRVCFAEQLQKDSDGGLPMNDPEVMERIALALERIAYHLEWTHENRLRNER